MAFPFSQSISNSDQWITGTRLKGVVLLVSLPITVLALSHSAVPETVNPSSPPSSTNPTLVPEKVITPVQGKVSIRFVNLTGASIAYQVIDVTEYRTLAGRSGVTLQGLAVPTTLTFRRQDNGFLLVNLETNQPQAGILTVTVRETPDFAADRTSIYIDPSGGVYLN